MLGAGEWHNLIDASKRFLATAVSAKHVILAFIAAQQITQTQQLKTTPISNLTFL